MTFSPHHVVDSDSRRSQNQSVGSGMSMRLKKVCPQCSAVLHARKLACQCGHVFRAKPQQNERKRLIESRETDNVRKAAKRACETQEEALNRQAQNAEHMASVKESETRGKSVKRLAQNKQHKASVRACATGEETLKRQAQNKQHMASVRACATGEETLKRQAQNKQHVASVRACATGEETLKRQAQNKQHVASVRACATGEETLKRQAQNKQHMASVRACATGEETLKRQAQNKQHMASVRASETSEQALHRRQSNKQTMSSTRKRNVSVECAVSAFHSEVRLGPDYVCTCCHRMMYRKSVILCNKAKYTKAGADVVQKVFSADLRYISFDGKQWVCRTCDRTLKRGNMPLQAKANGLQLCQVLSSLNALELRLICLRVPFMKVVALPTGKQRSIHGPAVNVPSKVDTICELLPRLPSHPCPAMPRHVYVVLGNPKYLGITYTILTSHRPPVLLLPSKYPRIP